MIQRKNYLIFIYNKWLCITIILTLLILLLSLYPIDASPNSLSNDKAYHLIAYSLLSFPVSIKKPPFYILICLFFIIFGGFIELIQPYFNRYFDISDFLTNSVGVLIGMIIGSIMRRNNFQG